MLHIFGMSQARHFCGTYKQSAGAAEGSLRDFKMNRLGKTTKLITEGSSLFDEYRDCLLRETGRFLFFAISNYRRALDLLTPASCSWAHVTLYYSSWFSAHAILGMLGCSVPDNGYAIDVARGDPGRQQLKLSGIGSKGSSQHFTSAKGSHRQFWDLYYQAINPLQPMVDVCYAAVLSPISSDHFWQISHRNAVNYDTHVALELSKVFSAGFQPGTFPGCLPGPLATQFSVTEKTMCLACELAGAVGLKTDALQHIGSGKGLAEVGTLILNAPISGVSQPGTYAHVLTHLSNCI